VNRLASVHASSPQHTGGSTRTTCPPHVFEQITDILADLVLEDLKQYSQIPASPRIDRFGGRENTVRVTQSETKALKVAELVK
jgi:hypothetical protein